MQGGQKAAAAVNIHFGLINNKQRRRRREENTLKRKEEKMSVRPPLSFSPKTHINHGQKSSKAQF
jgi:hypothetical protein